MNTMPSSPTAGWGSTTSAIAATGSQIAAANAENSHTNVAPPPAVLASTFQVAWASAARTTRPSATVDIGGLLSDGPRRGQDGSSLRAFIPSGLDGGADLSPLGHGPPGPHCRWLARSERGRGRNPRRNHVLPATLSAVGEERRAGGVAPAPAATALGASSPRLRWTSGSLTATSRCETCSRAPSSARA